MGLTSARTLREEAQRPMAVSAEPTVGRQARRGIRLRGDLLMIVTAVLAAVYIIGPPLGMTLYSAFRVPGNKLPFEGGVTWGLDNFTKVYTNGALQNTLTDTAIFAAGSVLVGFTIGFILAWLVERTDLPFRNYVFVLLLFPLMMPAIVVTIGWMLLLSNRVGMVNVVLRTFLPFFKAGPLEIFSMYGMIIVQGFGLVTLMFIFVSAALRSMDPSLEEASRASGASFITTARRVVVPILRPSVLGAIVLGVILTTESFEVPLLLSVGADADILSTHIWYALNSSAGNPPDYGTVSALGLHFMIVTYFLFYVYHRLTKQGDRYATMTGKGFRARRYELGVWRWVMVPFVVLFLFMQSIAPLLILVWTSFLPAYIPVGQRAFEKLSLDQYRELFSDHRLPSAVANTVMVSIFAPTIAVMVALVIAWVVVRHRGAPRLRLMLDLFTSSSIAIPGVIAANAFLLFYINLGKWVPIYGTVTVLVLVYAYRMAVAYRLQRAGVVQIARELEEVSQTSGGSGMQTFRHVLLPLVSPSVFGAWVLLFLVAFREFTLPLIVHRATAPHVISVLVFNLWGLDQGQAAALGVLTVVFLATVLIFIRVYVMKKFRSF